MRELHCEVAVIGGGLGGVAAAYAAASLGRRVVLTEESDWLGGQLTSQAVPPDEHRWIESEGATRGYRRLRNGIRAYYRRHHRLSEDAAANPLLNPGGGSVSPLCHEPRVALAVIDELLAPFRTDGQLVVRTGLRPTAVASDGDRVRAVTLVDAAGTETTLTADYVIDATELGELLELGGVEHVVGAESRDETGELHAVEGPARPSDQQSFTWCFALDYDPVGDHTIERPADYDHWRAYTPGDFWPGPLLSWCDVSPITLQPRTRMIFDRPDSWTGGRSGDFWNYRRIVDVSHHRPGRYASDVTLVNWPQIDYMAGPLVGVDAATADEHLAASRALSLSLLYWMQTEAPRLKGVAGRSASEGHGYPGLRLRGDLLGSNQAADGLAMRPYIRESRRIRAELTVVEEHVGVAARKAAGLPPGSELFSDSVGVGSYRIDLHPSTGWGRGPRNYIDVADYPFQIPLGALLPQRVENLVPANKNIGTTHITNGCYRLHPVEWNIGEAAGALVAHCLDQGEPPRAIRADERRLAAFQQRLTTELGFQLGWSEEIRTTER